MLKVMHIISGDLWAGAEVMVCTLLHGLNSYPDVNLSVIVLNEGRLAEEMRANGINVWVVNENHLSFPALVLMTRNLVRSNSPDIIHAHRYKENLLSFLASTGTNRSALISTIHGLPEIVDKRPFLLARCKSKFNFFLLSRFFARTVAVSSDISNQLQEHYGFADARVKVIHNGVTTQNIKCNKCTSEFTPYFTIGSSGRLFPVKDFPLFVEIARIIAYQEPEVCFELAGEGLVRAQLECLLKVYGLQDRFILRGHIDDMEPFYAGLDLYLNTSLHEGIPMTILEAMSRGLPVIAPRVGGIREIITSGEDGFLVDGRDPRIFAERCLQLYRDQQLRHAISMAAREKVVREFSDVKMVDSYYRLYCDATSSAHAEGSG